jgi:CRP-like cAMP-binding protein
VTEGWRRRRPRTWLSQGWSPWRQAERLEKRQVYAGTSSRRAIIQINGARVVEPALLLVVPAEAFSDAVRQNRAARVAFDTLLGQRMALAEARVAEIATHSVRSRLLHVLRRMALESGVCDSRGWAIADHITQEELASMVGASRVSVSHALGALRAAGQILVTGRRIVVRDLR